MLIIPELWREIKLYLFHNIKIHGKHLVNHKYNITYNNVMVELKNKYKKHIPMGGPKILYTSKKGNFHCIKLYYGIPKPSCYKIKSRIYSVVIETIYNFTKNHDIVEKFYLNNN